MERLEEFWLSLFRDCLFQQLVSFCCWTGVLLRVTPGFMNLQIKI